MTEEKLSSRKFIVWLVWGIIVALTIAIVIFVMAITKSLPDTIIEIVKSVLEYFFYVSLVYLGVNGIQKVGVAVADAITTKKEGEE